LLFEPLCAEEMVLVVGPRHPLANRRRVRMVELHRRELALPPRKFTTRLLLDEAFQAAGAEPCVAVEMSSLAAILALVQQTAFATIVSRSALPSQGGLHAIALEGPTLVRTPGLIWAVDRPRSPAVASFASIVRTVAKSPRVMSAIGRGSPGSNSTEAG
jgi:LysR family cyn operon transcriptional activator